MWQYARYLASVGHQVTFVAAAFKGAPRREQIDGLNVVRLGGIHSLWLTTFVRYMSEWRGQFDVVIAEGFGGSRVPRLAPLYVRQPLLTEWHQLHAKLFAVQYPKFLNGPLNLLERVAIWVNRNTHIRAGTDEWRDAFQGAGFKPDNVFVVPVSVPDSLLNANGSPPPSAPNLLWLGKIRRYKCPDHLIEAMPEILRSVPGARLVVAGRSDDRKYTDDLRQLARRLSLGNSVEFRLDLTEAQKTQLLGETRILVVPSVVEGFGIVVLEANAFGVPVVASSGVPEGAVEDGVNGLRYEFGDRRQLATQVVRLLQDQALYSRLSSEARRRTQRYTWSKVGEEYERVVLEVAAGKP